MVLSEDGQHEVISVEESKLRAYKKQFEEANDSFYMQIKLNNVLIAYLDEEIKKCTL